MVQSLRCRTIGQADLPQVIDVLTQAFAKQRSRAYWTRALAIMGDRLAPDGFPQYGTLLASGDQVVGVLLQLFSVHPLGVRCNMSSWCVRPDFRAYGSLMVQRALRYPATYTNLTPAPHTFTTLEAQGYRRFCQGRVLALPWLRRDRDIRARIWTADGATLPPGDLAPEDRAVLQDHAGYGCVCIVAEHRGRPVPMVFAVRRRLGVVGLAILTWCPAPELVARLLPAAGRVLARRGLWVTVLDADGPIPGIPGVYHGGRPKYARGPNPPHAYDHAYSERAMFGS